MARRGRPEFKPTGPQRDRVKMLRADGWRTERIARDLGIDPGTLQKHFAEELEHGADISRAALLDLAWKGARKGNATLIKWLSDQQKTRQAALELEKRGELPADLAAEPKSPKPGKKELQKEAATKVKGIYETPEEPTKLH